MALTKQYIGSEQPNMNHPLHDSQEEQQEQEQEQTVISSSKPATLKQIIKRNFNKLINKKTKTTKPEPETHTSSFLPLYLPESSPYSNYHNHSRSQPELLQQHPRHSSCTTSTSAEFSWRNHHHPHDPSSTSSSSPSSLHSNWFGRLTASRPSQLILGSSSDRHSVHTAHTSLPGHHSPNSFNSGKPPLTGIEDRFSDTRPSNDGLNPVFGISIKESLALSSHPYRSLISGHTSLLPTIVFKCGQRLKCTEGMSSRGIFRINGNVKRMRELQNIFMDPCTSYGKDFNIQATKSQLFGLPQPPSSSDNDNNLPYFSLHDVAGVLRRYLWALPEPLVPHQATLEMIKIWRRYLIETNNKGVEVTRNMEHQMIIEFELVLKTLINQESLDLIHYLFELLGLFSLNSTDNLMNSKNLSIVFQPGIMHLSSTTTSDNRMGGDRLRNSYNSRIISYPSRFLKTPPLSSSSPPTTTTSSNNQIGLHEYLGQIDEVQEVLRMLIDRFAILTSSSSSSSSVYPTLPIHSSSLPPPTLNDEHQRTSPPAFRHSSSSCSSSPHPNSNLLINYLNHHLPISKPIRNPFPASNPSIIPNSTLVDDGG
ncbi:hypothetical protein MJO29_000641 [Puccinia striiformis f. sp. tritici]|nr:hypothetical protein MJO29_000641 [Puccinia striiformis f. sp. tritici]